MYTKDAQGNWGRKFVFDGRDFVEYDPNNPRHKGLPQYDWGWQKQGDSIPYYGQDMTALLAQYGFPGAASGLAFGSQFLEPNRQRNIVDLLNQTTATGANARADIVQQGLQSNARSQADQAAATAYGGNAPANFRASAGLAAQNQANMQGNMFRAQETDPMTMAMKRAGILEGAYRNPLLEQLRSLMPGMEQQRQNRSFFGDLLNAGIGMWGSGAFSGGGGGRRGGFGSQSGGDGGIGYGNNAAPNSTAPQPIPMPDEMPGWQGVNTTPGPGQGVSYGRKNRKLGLGY